MGEQTMFPHKAFLLLRKERLKRETRDITQLFTNDDSVDT
jgi:hypothetical protein